MNKASWDLLNNQIQSEFIYHILINSRSMFDKVIHLECGTMGQCLDNALRVRLTNEFGLTTGSTGEGTHITSDDYGKHLHSTTPCYISDLDVMHVLYHMWVIDEGDTLPKKFDNYIYCQAERGKHTTDGFRKLRVIHRPQYYSPREGNRPYIINKSVENGYISSSIFLATTLRWCGYSPMMGQSVKKACGTQGPSQIVEYYSDSAKDFVACFHVKTWPKEAESRFKGHTHWPDMQLKSKIRKTGYLLVPTGNSNSQESDLEWRCSFSIAEKILFQSMTTFQRCTFVTLKVLLKEYLPSDINTDGDKQLLSTYHMKTVFLWSLEDSQLKWEPENMLDIIGHILDKLLRWIKRQFFPHYFIPTVNLLDRRRLHHRKKLLICCISAIRKDLSHKIKQSQFFMGQEIVLPLNSKSMLLIFTSIHHIVMQYITGNLENAIHWEVFDKMNLFRQINFSLLVEKLISVTHDRNLRMQHFYRSLYTDPFHDKLLTEVVPGLIDQYRGCIHLAKYCMAARDGRVLPDVLHTAESLLKDTLHLDPCSGYVKLACLYIVTGDLVKAIEGLQVAENNFLSIHKNMVSSFLRNLQLNEVEVDRLSTKLITVTIYDVFQKWVEGQVTRNIVVTWPEYITVPDIIQFELIIESKLQCIGDSSGKMVVADLQPQWPPLIFIKLLKFVCALKLCQSSTSHLENLVADLITGGLSVPVFKDVHMVNDLYTVFNMAAWCYVKIHKYKASARMMTVAIGTSSETKSMRRCAFSQYFLAHVIGQCLQ